MPARNNSLRIGFLGAGKMATALARGWLAADVTVAGHVFASDPLAPPAPISLPRLAPVSAPTTAKSSPKAACSFSPSNRSRCALS